MLNDPSSDSPWTTFKSWMTEAKATGLRDPNAMVLSTCGENGQPHSRVVLCKDIRDGAIVFYTNYGSPKGVQLHENKKCAINFFWHELHRQIKMEGAVEKASRQTSEQYWATRSRASQLSQWVSKQSQELKSRERMEREIEEAEKKFSGKDIPCPGHWGGYVFTPHSIEFWIGGVGRFHDRYGFTKVQNAWSLKRLYP